ncbi:hypothetical protein S7711_01744 [Stachybotrys chartarum IBT 7711]|uniref:Protein kinase domain-containing protein n=1 Tax=Stachybotrys chartarum (strain CBS 109288 / IBT 7711) TaxID=1280523 RepID=A0A084AVG4_STACB|nr:hypothetical protein S7711_01744 [Stachybotrys chartarum IBT 7711]
MDTRYEYAEKYSAGGYYPAKLDDVLNDRYKIVRKLGYGRKATVWLAVDQREVRLVALKIMVSARGEEDIAHELHLYQIIKAIPKHNIGIDGLRIVIPDDHFRIHGPGGVHLCLVSKAMALSADQAMSCKPSSHSEIHTGSNPQTPMPFLHVKSMLREVLWGLDFLHRNGLAHGNLHMGNILLECDSMVLENADLERLRQTLWDTVALKRLDGQKDTFAPQYLVQPNPLKDFRSRIRYVLTDLSGGFEAKDASEVPATMLEHYRSPEFTLGEDIGTPVDVWAFGCLTFQLLCNKTLFAPEMSKISAPIQDPMDNHLVRIVEVAGPLQKVHYEAWPNGRKYVTGFGFSQHIADGQGPRWFPMPTVPAQIGILEELFYKHKAADMNDKAASQAVNLIRKCLNTYPVARATVPEILAHPFFAGASAAYSHDVQRHGQSIWKHPKIWVNLPQCCK